MPKGLKNGAQPFSEEWKSKYQRATENGDD
jgi:hypothetical protein